jgi:hypothetical protein
MLSSIALKVSLRVNFIRRHRQSVLRMEGQISHALF